MMTYDNTNASEPVRIGRYANVLMDRWFKRSFGWAPAKRLMQLFLQELIPERTITEISFGPQEHINPIDRGKDIRLDVQCRDTNGRLFIVEVQLSEQSTFYERAVFNSSFVIQEQLPRGTTDWDFAPIYFIGIVNFSIHKGSDQVLFRYRIKEVESGEPMTDRIEYIFLEVPNCRKALTPQAGILDNLCYILGHISQMDERPEGVEGEIFDLLFKSAEIANFAPRERKEYIKDMTTERDIKNQLAFAHNSGVQQGLEIGDKRRAEDKVNTARNFIALGVDLEIISKATGISVEELEKLRS